MQLFLHSATFFSIPVKTDWTHLCSTFGNTENKNPNLSKSYQVSSSFVVDQFQYVWQQKGNRLFQQFKLDYLRVFYVNTIKWPMLTFLCATLDCKTVERPSCLEKYDYLLSFYPAAASHLFWSLSRDAFKTAEIGFKLPEFEEMPDMSGGVSRETHFQKRYLDDSYLVPWWICGYRKTWLWIIHLLSTSCGVTWCREQASIYFSYV